MEPEQTLKTQNNLEKKTKVRSLTLSDFNIY